MTPSCIPGLLAALLQLNIGAAPPFSELAKLYQYQRNAPLGLVVQNEEDREGIKTIRISYSSPKGGVVPATLLVPPGKGPFPTLIFMHPAGGPDASSYFLGEALEYAEKGVLSLLVTAPFLRPPPNQVPLYTFTEADRDAVIQCVIDLRRAVDVLLSRSDVDSKRLGFVGYSYGALVGGILSGVEKRIKAYVLMGGAAKLTSLLYTMEEPGADELRRRGQFMDYLRMMTAADPDEYVRRARPASLLFQSARRDEFVAREDASLFYEVASDPKELKWYDADHGLNDEARADRAVWLSKVLRLSRREKEK